MLDDKQLKQSVLAELAWEPNVAAAHIGVAVQDGVVTLTGHVPGFVERHLAETAVGRVKGVRGIAEEMEVRLPFDNRRGDEEIAAAALARLDWDVTVPKDAIRVTVEQGWVTLEGQVDRHHQKQAAEWDVRGLTGVVGITDKIAIRPAVDPSNLSDAVTHALHRSLFYDSRTVTVTARGGEIHLGGTVHSWHDRQVAGDTAWAAPGATLVVNEIAVI